jgi:hypothetical protein
MKKLFILMSAVVCFFFLTSFAPPGEPGGSPEEDDPPVGVAVPIDGGAVALLLAGAAYGAKKIKDNKK